MKQVLFLLLTILSYSAYGQNTRIQEYPVQADSQIVLGRLVDSTNGRFMVAPYMGILSSSVPVDNRWVIRPIVEDVNTDSMRWFLLEWSDTLTVSTTTYTVKNYDFDKQVSLTNTVARTITMPNTSIVNTNKAIRFKDAAGTSGINPITINYSGGIDGGTSVQINCNYCELALYKKGTIYSVK